MKRLLCLGLIWLLTSSVLAATYYVDDSYYDMTNTLVWTILGITRPNYEWHLGELGGLDYDTLGPGGVFRNYGSTALTTGLTAGVMPSLTEGISSKGQAAGYFDPALTNYLQDANTGEVDIAGNLNFTLIAWLRQTDTTGTYQFIAGKQDPAVGNAAWTIRTKSGAATLGQDTLEMYLSGADADAATLTASSALTKNKWHLVGMTHLTAADSIKLYLDGAVSKRAVMGAVPNTFSGAIKFTIGCRQDNAGFLRYFMGDIAYVAVWVGTALTNAQMNTIYAYMNPSGVLADPFPSLQGAVYQATAGDTLLVAAGNYYETVQVGTAFDAILGLTHVSGSLPIFNGALVPLTAGLIGMTISAKNEIGWMTFRGYSTALSGIGIKADATSDGTLIHHVEFDSCFGSVNFDGACDGDSVVNCTIDGAGLTASKGVWATTDAARTMFILNCIVTGCVAGIDESQGTYAGGYNDLFSNTVDYFLLGGTLTGDRYLNPMFVNQAGNDHSLRHCSRLNNGGTVIHSGIAAFTYLQTTPAVGVWETTLVTGGQAFRAPWAREAWARGTWGRGVWGR